MTAAAALREKDAKTQSTAAWFVRRQNVRLFNAVIIVIVVITIMIILLEFSSREHFLRLDDTVVCVCVCSTSHPAEPTSTLSCALLALHECLLGAYYLMVHKQLTGHRIKYKYAFITQMNPFVIRVSCVCVCVERIGSPRRRSRSSLSFIFSPNSVVIEAAMPRLSS